MTPVVFGSCRGWLELPPEGVPVRDGIVMFGAYGVEDLSTRYSLARLAARLAEAGHPVLRFDLPGTGDSLGDWQDPGQLSAWVAAGRAAITALQSWSGVSSVALLGLRLGGAIATLVAQASLESGSPLSGLALLAPVIKGRQYIRELQALSNGSPVLTVAGFSIHQETQLDLAAIDLCAMAQAPVRRLFLGVPSASKAMNTLQAQWACSASMCCAPYPELAQHIGETATNYVPSDMFDQLVAWFATGQVMPIGEEYSQASNDLAAKQSVSIGDARLSADGYVEQGVVIPAQVSLTGVWCHPNRELASAMVVVFCNSGLNPHIGGARTWVCLARRLAQQGVASVRFDLAGTGDSAALPNAPQELVYHSVGIPQVRAVIDYVEQVMAGGVICLVGICSGGFLAFHEAVTDSRVTGVVLTNVQCFLWRDGMSLQEVASLKGRSKKVYQRRLFQAETWHRLIFGQVNVFYIAKLLSRGLLFRIRESATKMINLVRHFFRGTGFSVEELSPEDSIRRGFTLLAERGVKIAVVYGDEDVGLDEFARYYGSNYRKFSRLPHARLAILTEFDHDVHQVVAQNKLFEEVCKMRDSLLASPPRSGMCKI